MEQPYTSASRRFLWGLVVLLTIALAALLAGCGSADGRAEQNETPASIYSDEGEQARPLRTANPVQSQEGVVTPEAEPLGTEGDPADLECLKRQLEQTSVSPQGAQQAEQNEASGENSQGQPINTDTLPPTQQDDATAQDIPLGTEGDAADLECLKRQMEQTSVPSTGPQQTDSTP